MDFDTLYKKKMVTTVPVPPNVYAEFRNAYQRFATRPKEKFYFDSLVLCAREMSQYSDGFIIMNS